MIADLEPYPAMKDSGVEWLGEVPEHWGVRRLKADVANIVDQTSDRSTGESYVALEHVESWTGRIREANLDSSFESQVKRFNTGDVLFGKLRPYLAKVARPDRSGICVGEFLVLRPRGSELDSGYLEQFLRSKPTIDVIDASTFGAKMPRADWSFIGNIKQLLPPLPEQAAIVRYLDYVDRRVRRFVRAKQKLIGLLEEQEQAVIHRAVTRGLDPDAPLKDSGVEWLGQVPAHWEVRRAKCFYREIDERSDSGSEELMSVSHKTGVTPRKKNVTMFLATNNVGHKICRPGDLAINTMWAYMGALGIAWQTGIVSPSYGVYQPIDPEVLEPDFIDCLLRTEGYKSEYLCRSTGITSSRLRLYRDAFLCIPILCPPRLEQTAIVRYINEKTSDVRVGIKQTEREIELLNEYRTRLIADAVTGKLDVREAAAKLPDVKDDLEPIDNDAAVDASPEEVEA